MKPFSISHLVKFTCWVSITLILWGVIAGIIQPRPVTWFAFAFFCVVGVFTAFATLERSK